MSSNNKEALDWLLASDPAIRWQTMRDILDAPEAEWSAERRKVETEGLGAKLLSHQGPDGQWAGGCFVPEGFDWNEMKTHGQPWTATCWALNALREFGLDPSSETAKRIVELVGKNSKWDEGGQPYWEGETEECINGRTVADGAYFGADVSKILRRLLGEIQEDGGWNCERANGSKKTSFASTINVLEGLLEHEKAHGASEEITAARKSGEEYLLKRELYKRLTTGQPADEKFLQLVFPPRWRYDVLRALDYFRKTGQKPDPRMKEAVEHVRSKQREDGKWASDWSLRGRVWPDVDNEVAGEPSPWITLKAMRVLKWWDGNQS